MAGNPYSWAGASRLLQKDIHEEERALGGAARKSGTAGSVGGVLGTLGGLALLGPLGIAATPLAMAIAGGVGSLAGSGLGRQLFTSPETKKELRGSEEQLFLQSDRQELQDELFADQLSSAISTAMTVGLGEGFNVAKGNLLKETALTTAEGAELGEAALSIEGFDVRDIGKYRKNLDPGRLGAPTPQKTNIFKSIFGGKDTSSLIQSTQRTPVQDFAARSPITKDRSIFSDADEYLRNLG